MGLKSIIVLGYAKSGDYIVGNDSRVNHAWNAVEIDGNWHLMDPTWGAGIVKDKAFIANFNSFYFATKPEEFIYTHFPEDKKWQLLTNIYSRSQFDNLPSTSADLFKNDIKLVSHQSDKIAVDNSVMITLQAPEDIIAIANIKWVRLFCSHKKD